MWWSYSASRSFRQCQRQWFFKNVVANSNAKDPFRRRVYLLSKLQSISAWRGGIVDNVISKTLIPNLNRGVCVTLKQAKRFARGLFERQLVYARRHPITDLSLQVSKEGDDFAVFHAVEYEKKLPEHEIERAWCEVEAALVNLFALDDIKRILKLSNHIVVRASAITAVQCKGVYQRAWEHCHEPNSWQLVSTDAGRRLCLQHGATLPNSGYVQTASHSAGLR